MKILAVETSCDETSATVVEGKKNLSKVILLSNVVSSSLSLHSETGGIIPEIAAREQVRYILPVINEALEKANVVYPSTDVHCKVIVPYSIRTRHRRVPVK